MIGRETICTPELTKKITDNITLGLNNYDSATLAGIGEKTFYNWIQRGNKEIERINNSPNEKISASELPFVQFLQAVKKAESLRKQVLVGHIQAAVRGKQVIKEITTVTRTDKNGNAITETKVTEKEQPPTWQAAAWLLERKYPMEFGRQIQVSWRNEMQTNLPPGVTIQDADQKLRELLLTVADTMEDESGEGS